MISAGSDAYARTAQCAFLKSLQLPYPWLVTTAAPCNAHAKSRPRPRRPDISKIYKALGWQPKVVLREGLPSMVADFRKRLAL